MRRSKQQTSPLGAVKTSLEWSEIWCWWTQIFHTRKNIYEDYSQLGTRSQKCSPAPFYAEKFQRVSVWRGAHLSLADPGGRNL